MKSNIHFIKTVLKGIAFSNPQKNKLLIFDEMGSYMMRKILLYDVDYTVLPVRNEQNRVSVEIIALMIKNLARIIFKKTGKEKLRSILRNTYILSFIEYISPVVVLTWIDNSRSFRWISRHYEGATFFAIQNGTRIIDRATKGFENFGSSSLSYMCFGEYEKDLFTQCGYKVDNFFPIGSLKGGFYKFRISQKPRVEYDICLISELREEMILEKKMPVGKQALDILYGFCKRYIDEHTDLTLRIACKNDSDEVVQYFKAMFGNRAYVEKNRQPSLKTYEYMDRSDVIVAFNSTAAFEAFGWGKKVLLCNFSGRECYSFPLPGICTMDMPDYHTFRDKLDYLRELELLTYNKLTENAARYFMNYDPEMPPDTFIRNKIFECLEINGKSPEETEGNP